VKASSNTTRYTAYYIGKPRGCPAGKGDCRGCPVIRTRLPESMPHPWLTCMLPGWRNTDFCEGTATSVQHCMEQYPQRAR
jgi:hypothetical protein